jgi:ABC-2 type transport system permease protein
MTVDPAGVFVPRPGAAPYAAMVRVQAAMETRLLLRNGEQLLLAIVIPILALVGGVVAARRIGLELSHPPVDALTPGVLALAVMSTSFTSLAISTGFERRYGLLKRLGASPLPRSGLLAGKVGALVVVEALQALVIGAVALALGWRPEPAGALVALPVALLGTAAFAGLGLLLAGTLRAEATLAAANLVYLLLLAGGAVVLPRSSYGAAGAVLQWLPSAALGDGMRAAFLHGQLAVLPLLVLLAWAIVGTALAARFFRWE